MDDIGYDVCVSRRTACSPPVGRADCRSRIALAILAKRRGVATIQLDRLPAGDLGKEANDGNGVTRGQIGRIRVDLRNPLFTLNTLAEQRKAAAGL